MQGIDLEGEKRKYGRRRGVRPYGQEEGGGRVNEKDIGDSELCVCVCGGGANRKGFCFISCLCTYNMQFHPLNILKLWYTF